MGDNGSVFRRELIMLPSSKDKNGPNIPDAANLNMKHLAFKLEEALAQESPRRPLHEDRKPWEVTNISRDGAVHILRFLRIWFDLPHKVFFSAVSFLDQFLTKMKVREKFLKCLTISCLYVAVKQNGCKVDEKQLVTVSQSKCSVKDMLRMADIVKQKVKWGNEEFATAADFLTIYVEMLDHICTEMGASLKNLVPEEEQLLTRLEVLMTDHNCAFYRPSVIALILMQLEIQRIMTERRLDKSYQHLGETCQFLAIIGRIQSAQYKPNETASCFNTAKMVLQQYDNQKKAKYPQNLSWRFSSSTHAAARFRNRNFFSPLSPIQEKSQIV